MGKWFILILGGILLYLCFFPGRTVREFSLTPAWAIDLRQASASHRVSDDLVPFRNKSQFGYTTTAGELAFIGKILHGVAIAAPGYVNYSSIGKNLVFQLPDGTIEASLDTRGYPMFLDGRLFILSTNRTRIEEWEPGGALLWSRDFGVLITALDARGTMLSVGLMDGRVQLCGSKGEVLFERRLSGSRVEVVYGCTVSARTKQLIVVHGLDPQLLSVFTLREGQYEETVSVVLSEEFRSNRLVWFSSDERMLFVEGSDGILAFRDDGEFVSNIRASGTLAAFGELESERLLWFVCIGTENRLVVTTATGGPVFSERFDADYVSCSSSASSVYLSVDNLIGKLDVSLQ